MRTWRRIWSRTALCGPGSPESAFDCGPAGAWDEFAAHAGEAITAGQDGLWQLMSDSRIRAVMPMAGEGWWLFGERGLAAVDRPTLIVAATAGELDAENALIFEHLGTPDKALTSFVGPSHMMVFDAEMKARMAHFAASIWPRGQAEREIHLCLTGFSKSSS